VKLHNKKNDKIAKYTAFLTKNHITFPDHSQYLTNAVESFGGPGSGRKAHRFSHHGRLNNQ
jgi:hypothetical protein